MVTFQVVLNLANSNPYIPARIRVGNGALIMEPLYWYTGPKSRVIKVEHVWFLLTELPCHVNTPGHARPG